MKTIIIPITLLFILCIFGCSEKTTQAYSDTVSTPTFSLVPGMYYPQQMVTISCSTPGATIRYTVDGSLPNKHSTLYATPVQIDSTSTLKAIAYKKDWNQSAAASANYEIYHWTVGPGLMLNLTHISASPDTIYADDGETHSTISVTVKNSEGFGAPGQLVTFQTSVGNILPEATTDENGNATTTLRGEDVSGIALVKATIRVYHPDHPEFLIGADTVSVEVNILEILQPLPYVHTIQFTEPGQIDMNVLNTSSNDNALLRVRLFDVNGNLVSASQNVWFKIMNDIPPLGANLNNQPAGDSVMVVAENGEAQIRVYSGTTTGSLNIRVSCTSEGRYVTAFKSNINIVAGPPHDIELFSSGYNTGMNIGSGLWRIIVGAQMQDVYGNPCVYGSSVWFSLPDNVNNCQIGPAAYIGNESASGDSTAGVAYTSLIYSGVYTFESLKIRVVTSGINGNEIFAETEIVLPLNQPHIEIEIVPGSLIFHGNDNPVPSSATATLNASVFDGQGCPIHNARISMTTNRGTFEYVVGTNEDPLNCNLQASPNIIVSDWYDANAQAIPGDPTTYTDVNDGQDGIAQGQIRFYAWEVPLGEPLTGTPGTTTVTITGRILGTEASASSNVVLMRYPS